ncbi:hypothetical protein, partial [Xanthomonas cerealis]|uniref:hypothetical protein n=1 Tax=Xanthomonas cerealis TaxID=3390025 RepID=UPI00159F0749
LAAEAAASQSILGATRFGGPVKIADGVLDRFVADAPTLIALDVPANSAPTARRAPAWRAQPCAGDAAAFSVA